MCELTESEIDIVAQRIAVSITDQRLQMELIDHCCTRMEELMDANISFDEALNSALSDLSPKGLHIIQEECNYQINLKKEPMKITLYLSGFLAAFFILSGFLFKFMHWPGATFMLTFGDAMLIVAMIGILAPAIRYRKNFSSSTVTRLMSGSIGGLLFGVGAFFKLMWWPGANILVVLGIASLLLVFLPLFFLELYRREMRTAVK